MKTTRRMQHPAPKRPELDALLEKAKTIPFTKEMRAAQQESWVIGEMMLEHPEMTREEAKRIYDSLEK